MEHKQFLECVAERDIDLLVLEELHVSPPFREWFLSQSVGVGVDSFHFVGAWHSISHISLGESDLVAIFGDVQQKKMALLVENKIDAPPQPEQAARYRLRGAEGITNGDWDQFCTCIIAPEKYLKRTADASGYDVQLSYEKIREWFRERDERDPRAAYRLRMMDVAIDQSRRGYSPNPHAAVTKLWMDYYNIVRSEFPELQMNKPGGVPAGSDWIVLKSPNVGPNRQIKHKLGMGYVDLQIGGAGSRAQEIAERNQVVLKGEFEVVETGGSASIRALVPVVDRFGDVSSQIDAVRLGLTAATRLAAISPALNLD
jgi:hypothetical protein